jgi:glycosyltransferase involved in cell wall biosynthesis
MTTLTLAIPTYNSTAEHVLEMLESLAPQVAQHADRVSVVVVDNASDPESAGFLVECAARFPAFRFVRHEQNLGFDRNVVRLLDSVTSDFTWFFGDDDILLDFALDDMLAAIDAAPDALVVLCRAQFFHETAEVVQRSQRTLTVPRVLHGPEFVYETAFTAAALSTFCVSTRAMRESPYEFALGTNWVHFGVLIALCSTRPQAPSVFLDDAVIAVRRSNAARWFSNFGNQYRTGLGLLTLVHDGMAHGVDAGIYEFFRARRFATNHLDILTLAWPLTLAARRDVQATASAHFASYRRFRLLDTPLLFTPNWVKALGSASIRSAGRAKRALRIGGRAS